MQEQKRLFSSRLALSWTVSELFMICVCQKYPHIDLFARWRDEYNLIAGTERGPRLLAVSSTVSELLAMFVDRKWRYIDFSTRWHRGLNLMTDFETPTPTSYLRIIVSLAVSSTVSEL